MTQILLREDRGAVATLTLNRPEALNALSDAMLAALKEQFRALAEHRTIRVVVIRGAGKAFCAGHDLREMQAARQSDDRGPPISRTCSPAARKSCRRFPPCPSR